jgi:hypothetical protein
MVNKSSIISIMAAGKPAKRQGLKVYILQVVVLARPQAPAADQKQKSPHQNAGFLNLVRLNIAGYQNIKLLSCNFLGGVRARVVLGVLNRSQNADVCSVGCSLLGSSKSCLG